MASRGNSVDVAAAPYRLQRSLNCPEAPSKASRSHGQTPADFAAHPLLPESPSSGHIEFLRTICGWPISDLQAKRCQAVIACKLAPARCSIIPAQLHAMWAVPNRVTSY